MLPFMTKLIWGPAHSEVDEENERKQQAEIEHTTCEETDDWLIINCTNGERYLVSLSLVGMYIHMSLFSQKKKTDQGMLCLLAPRCLTVLG